MLELICDPPLPAIRPKTTKNFLQTIRLVDGDESIGQARWLSGVEAAHGVVQILELTVSTGRRRQGFGRRLMEAVEKQAVGHFGLRKIKLRRLWIAIEQKHQVVGRSFLMQFGFNHVGTISQLLKDEDLLVYMRTFN
jgi:GNAT superfamily N-acetyltransferase